MISILLPSRNRPNELLTMYNSALKTADNKIEFCVYIDDDDDSYKKIDPNIKLIKGPRITLSQAWQETYKVSSGDVLMVGGDDLIFRNKGWDTALQNRRKHFKDDIAMFFFDDGFWGAKFSSHPFLTRKWVELSGFFVPPYFVSDYNDLWIDEVATKINRKIYIPGFLIEHMHPNFGKSLIDETHKDRLQREKNEETNPQNIYLKTITERQINIKKLNESKKSNTITGIFLIIFSKLIIPISILKMFFLRIKYKFFI